MVVDEEALYEAMGQDEDTVRAVVATFLRALDAYQAELEACLADGGSQAVREVAHKLKGALANLRANEARAYAEALEMAAKESRNADFASLAVALSKGMRDVRFFFQAWSAAHH